MLLSLFSSNETEAMNSRRLLWLLILGSVPTAVIGLAFRKQFEAMFNDLHGNGVWFIITGALLFLTDRISTRGRMLSAMTMLDALVIGVAQGLAIIPALSRSGSTIAAGVFLGLERHLLVRYSFLLSIPAVAGAFALEVVSHRGDALEGFDPLSYGVGTLAAGIVGYWSIAVLLNMTRSRRLSVFGYYCVAVGVLSIFLASR
jgi:undecaprenyl-diphosphatase